jgi:hypothetical protein
VVDMCAFSNMVNIFCTVKYDLHLVRANVCNVTNYKDISLTAFIVYIICRLS